MTHYIFQLENIAGLDQGIHNYLIYKNQLPHVVLIKVDEGYVTTLGTLNYNEIKFNNTGQVIDNKGRIINVLHQYDRHLGLLWKFDKKGFNQLLINLIKRKLVPLKRIFIK